MILFEKFWQNVQYLLRVPHYVFLKVNVYTLFTGVHGEAGIKRMKVGLVILH